MSQSQVKLFRQALHKKMGTYDSELSGEGQTALATYYELLLRWNERLHLVAPCSAEDFATKHVLESLTLTTRFPTDAKIVDIGSGAGLPIIPCLIVRPDINATLIESSQKKSVFLREALKVIGALKRANIVTKPFEQSTPPDAQFVTCRALDDFGSKVRLLIQWAPLNSTLFLFGGSNLRQRLSETNYAFNEWLLPGSDQRFLFEVKRVM